MSAHARRAVVLLPTYNEKDNLGRIVPAILAAAPVDVLVLDDNSPDGTGQLAAAMAKQEPRVKVVHRPQKAGLGAAYRDGFTQALAADYAQVLQMDADFSHPPEHLPEMLRLAGEADVVLGSRWVPGGGTQNWPWRRQVLSQMGSLYARTILGVHVRDLTGGFKCFNRHVLRAIDLKRITSTGYAFQIEMTYRAIQKGFKVVESPITFVERAEGVSKMSRGIIVEAVLKVPGLRFGGRR
jgi:dolichol-phosphate mannosyltransferase